MASISLIPCYGRDYRSKKQIISDLLAGKDFEVSDFFGQSDGKPINLDEIREWFGQVDIRVRYHGLRKVCLITMRDLAKVERDLIENAADIATRREEGD